MLNRSKKLKHKFQHIKITSLMWGYRDLSLVISNRSIPEGKTEKLGFVEMIEAIQNLTSGLETEELLHALHQGGTEIKANNFQKLARSTQQERKTEEVAEIVEATKLAVLRQKS